MTEDEDPGAVTNVDPIYVVIGPFHILLPAGTRADEAARLLYLVSTSLLRGETDLTHLIVRFTEAPHGE